MYKVEQLKIRRKSWFKVAGIPASSVGWTLHDCIDIDDEIISTVKSWVNHVKAGRVIKAYSSNLCGKGLIIYGEPGLGKSTLASAILQEIITTFSLEPFGCDGNVLVRPCYFSSYVKMIALRGRTMDDDTSSWDERLNLGVLGECDDDAYNVRVLVIDDLGREHMSNSGWTKNLLHEIVRTRYENGLPTIITTNMPPSVWKEMYGDATESFFQEGFLTIPVKTKVGNLRLKP
jgi:DNA replication protein DnaC